MRSKAFRYLWVGQSFANAGDVLYIVALIAAIYQTTGSAFQMTLVPFVITFSKFISSVIAPILLDRYTLKHLLATSQALKTVLMLCLFLVVLKSIPFIWIVFLLAAFIAFLDGWALPASNALVPSIVKREELMKTNGFLSTLEQSIQFTGWAAGGIVTAIIQPAGTLGMTTLFYMISTFFMYSIPFYNEKYKGKSSPQSITKYIEQLSAGWKELWSNKILRQIQLISWVETIASVVWIAAIMYLFVQKQLHVGEEWWGFINSAFIAGLIIASVLLLKFHGFYRIYQAKILIICSICTACATFAFGINDIPVLALALSFVFGLFDQQKAVILQTLIQTKTDVERLPKVYSAQGAITTFTFGIVSLLSGTVVEVVGVRNIYIIASILLFISVFPVYLLRKNI
ncbi:MFS transporter [Bacillus sp. FJAT-49736]|uniref:MFS transporter n=1 Tax=Bacillus sp. FJAT-49736 TaxID=2833582 RepID=UPI001BC9B733|nr:MFS transporter [Bacillus sp. FJAT-49736]MBS4171806.1 MFS transporter [Bacillus sp. FJAT-49736]